MKGNIKREWSQIKWQLMGRVWLFVLLGVITTSSMGKPLESSLGWVACPLTIMCLEPRKKKCKHQPYPTNKSHHVQIRAGWQYGCKHWEQPLARSLLLVVMWQLSGGGNGGWMVWLPWWEWGVEVASVSCPWLGQQIEMRVMRWGLKQLRWGSIWLFGGLTVWHYRPQIICPDNHTWVSGISLPIMGCVVKNDKTVRPIEKEKAEVNVVEENGAYRIELKGAFYLTLPMGRSFWLRTIILVLRQLEASTPRQGSRATRDGRRPYVSQQQLAAWFGVKQPEISRWEKYLLAENWPDLLSLNTPLVLTWELRQQIVDALAHFPWWSIDKVTAHLQAQKVEVTHSQVQQAAQDVGWQRFKQTIQNFFVLSEESIRPRETGLVAQLLTQVDDLIEKVNSGAALTTEERVKVSHLQTMASELDLSPIPPPDAIPWARQLKWVLFAAATESDAGNICCTYCHSDQVRVKSKQPRAKRYQNEEGEWDYVDVYRYYCDNPDCSYGSFTHFPLGLLPHSPYPLSMRLAVVQLSAWGSTTYRRTATALGIKSGRAYEWVKAFGQELLPIAALFGVVRSSGVVGVDEKWVQIPDKAKRGEGPSPRGQAKRWMYVYLAVDVYTYDLLHVAIYVYNTKAAARTFLLGLKAKGYRPRVIVTDLRIDYGSVIVAVFPQATHHECIFHALQWWSRQFKEIYGKDYDITHPEAVQLKEAIQHIFQAKTKRTAQKRYQQVIALRDEYIQQVPEAANIFDSLTRHYPQLINSIESTVIPSTNNAVEMVIGRFDQLYQNFCGFDSIETARIFLAVFEKVYRFTPFSDDAQPRIRGKSPLEVAGYDISQLAMSHVCRGWALNLPLDFAQEGVPNL